MQVTCVRESKDVTVIINYLTRFLLKQCLYRDYFRSLRSRFSDLIFLAIESYASFLSKHNLQMVSSAEIWFDVRWHVTAMKKNRTQRQNTTAWQAANCFTRWSLRVNIRRCTRLISGRTDRQRQATRYGRQSPLNIADKDRNKKQKKAKWTGFHDDKTNTSQDDQLNEQRRHRSRVTWNKHGRMCDGQS
jgi:hypothetical protein